MSASADRPAAPQRIGFAPGGRLAPLAVLGVPFALSGQGGVLGVTATLAFDALLVVAGALEARALGKRAPHVERRLAGRLVVGVENKITLHLHNPHARPVRVTVRDALPAGFQATPDELVVALPPFARREVTYTVIPPRRGQAQLGDLQLKVEGGAGLGAAIVQVPSSATARVYPNVLGPRRYELAARLGQLSSLGLRNVRTAGGGGEFEQLREYVPGDSFRDFDWKSTAKRARPVTKVYQHERSQLVMLAIDASVPMATRLGAVSKLDHAVNAALLLAYVALRKGDRVGLVVFADVVKRFVPPGRGPGQYRTLLEALYAVEAEPVAVDFRRFTEFARIKLRRRALLVLFSELLDDAQASPLVEQAQILKRRHLPVCVTMRDMAAVRLAERKPEDARDVHRRAAAADVIAEREQVKARLTKLGVGLVEADAGELAVAIVNKYLEIKARQVL